jgi:transcriptional regulator with XRE-family HTH domain
MGNPIFCLCTKNSHYIQGGNTMSTRNKTTRGLPNLILQEERLARGWTQQEIANRIGTTVVNVSRWERGVTAPNPYFRQKLCVLFEKNAEELGLLVIKQVPRSEPPLAVADISPDPPAKEFVATSHEIASLSLRNRLLGEQKAVLATISIALVILVSTGGFLIHSFLFSQPGYIAQSVSHTKVTPTPMLIGNVIAKDTFQRANQTFWGTASDGLPWGGDANTLKNFSIANDTARIAVSNGSVYNAVLGARTSDAEVLFSGSLSDFDSSNLGAVLRWKDTNDWYKAYIDGRSLIIQKKMEVDKDPTYLMTVAFAANTSISYTIRFRVIGANLWAKVWPTASSEPDGWMATTHDSSFTEGFCGLRIQVRYGATATVTSFQATSLLSETR